MDSLLKGFVVCVSGLSEPDRNLVERRVVELGGQFTGCFTTHVTHLISSSTSTEKYRVALDLGVPIISPPWVSCLESSDDIEPFENYLLPPFKGILVCVSGFPTEVRHEIEQRVMELGGAFTLVLSKDCTHLICISPSGRKYEFAREWQLEIVSTEWLNECCKQRGRVMEAGYRISPSGQSGLLDGADDASSSYLERCHIFFGDGFDSDVLDYARKIVRDGGGNMSRTCDGLVSHYLISSDLPTEIDRKRIAGLSQQIQVLNYKWLGDCHLKKILQPVDAYLFRGDDPEPLIGLKPNTLRQKKETSFSFSTFAIHGFEDTQIRAMTTLISKYGGCIRSKETAAYIIVPFTNRSKKSLNFKGTSTGCLVTEYWFEASIEQNILLSPDSSVLYRPSMRTFPLRVSNMRIGITGYELSERFHLTRAIKLMGSTFCEKFSKSCHILVCHPTLGVGSAKFLKSKEWKVKVVDGSWVLSCLAEGRYVDCDDFVLPRDQSLPRRQTRDSRVLDLEADGVLNAATTHQTRGRDGESGHLSGPPCAVLATLRPLSSTPIPASMVLDNNEPTSESNLPLPLLQQKENQEVQHDWTDEYAIFARKPRSTSKRPLNMARDQHPTGHDSTTDIGLIKDKVGVVGYHDPDGLSEKRRLLDQAEQSMVKRARETSHSSSGEALSLGVSRALSKQVLSYRDQLTPKPNSVPLLHFQFSAIQSHQRPEMTALAKQLGGTVTSMDTWDTKCTHLIAFSVTRSEKYLCACASGKWILKPTFLLASQKAGKFVPEEDHEWNETDPLDGASAARYWRKEIQINGCKGSFFGFRILLLVEERKRKGLSTVLRCGGAHVLSAKPSLRGVIEGEYTHAIVDSSMESSLPKLLHINLTSYSPEGFISFLFSTSKDLEIVQMCG
ncbi:hypothetical protein BASA50_000429 [Batrachochytrium salamandrivorans]|uniref:BRCT domain-containing protein n=1 Tax=Batrachochytrium salamandrivorans TaxID=1357716 RepID=A0ABQ8EU72_9FUNG|nr:hypothetical protein BASA50_000429 [Batrachochytrium salamandrivorans]